MSLLRPPSFPSMRPLDALETEEPLLSRSSPSLPHPPQVYDLPLSPSSKPFFVRDSFPLFRSIVSVERQTSRHGRLSFWLLSNPSTQVASPQAPARVYPVHVGDRPSLREARTCPFYSLRNTSLPLFTQRSFFPFQSGKVGFRIKGRHHSEDPSRS